MPTYTKVMRVAAGMVDSANAKARGQKSTTFPNCSEDEQVGKSAGPALSVD